MKNFTLNEIKGKLHGDVIIVNAENAIDAMQKVGMSHWCKSHEKFNEIYFGKVYEVYETDKPYKAEYICHR